MKAYDFEYDNKKLSDFGFIICSFSDKGLDTVADGSQISFNTVSVLGGEKSELTSTQYKECLGGTIQICKHSCAGGVQEISAIEHRNIARWLNRKKFLKLKFLSEEFIDIYFEASFNISRIELDGRLFGFELEVVTNRPYALKEPRKITIQSLVEDSKHSVNDISHEEGFIYPYTEIAIAKDGNLNIYNAMENRNTYIKNCKAGEVIIMDYPVISSSISSHNIQNDFNWNFFRVANTFDNSKNDLTISLPCTIKIEYSPIVKVGL